MLETMRRNTKIILWVTVITFVLLIFLVWGADVQRGTSTRRPDVVGSVNGQRISRDDYQRMLSNSRNNAQASGRRLEPSDEIYLEEQSWNALVEDALIRQEATKHGFSVKDSEVRVLLLNVPPPFITQSPNFRDAQGNFDMAAYRSLLSSPSTPENVLLQLEQYVRETVPTDKLRRLVTSGAKVTENELREAYANENEKAKLVYVLATAAAMEGTPEPGEADVETYYREHADTYRLPKRVSLRYVSLPRAATAADSNDVLTDLRDYADQARRAAVAAAEGTEDTQDSDFPTLAVTFSDLASADSGGVVPAVEESQLSPGTRSAVAGLAPGQISEPFIEGGFGRIVQVESAEGTPGARRLTLRELGVRISPSETTMEETRNRMETLRTDAVADGLGKAAAAAGLPVQETPGLVEGGMAPGLAALPLAATFAHTNPQGTVSRVYMTNTAWIVLEVGSTIPEGTPPLAEIRDRVAMDARRAARMDASKKRIESLMGLVRSGRTLEDAAASLGLTVTTPDPITRRQGFPAMGREAGLLAAAFEAPTGEVRGPVETGSGWAALRVVERTEPDWSQFDQAKIQLLQMLLYQKQSRLYSAYVQGLKDKAKIEDYRS